VRAARAFANGLGGCDTDQRIAQYPLVNQTGRAETSAENEPAEAVRAAEGHSNLTGRPRERITGTSKREAELLE
jgi:hypothetical protein